MSQGRANLYEALILLDQNAAAADFGGCVNHVRDILERASAEVTVLRKWGDIKLAYEINGQKRGTYLLAYFKALGSQVSSIERDCRLSEKILRALILRADHVGETELDLAKRDETVAIEAQLRGGETVAEAEMGEGETADMGEDVEPARLS